MKRAPFRTLALGAVIGGLALTLTTCAPGITTMISVNQNGIWGE